MKVAIIGAGNVGRALGTSIAAAGNDVIFASTGGSATAAAESVGSRARAAGSPADAAAAADVVILAVPYSAAQNVADQIAGRVAGKIVVDATNPLAPDMSGLATGHGTSGAETVAARLPDAIVVKAFNTIFATVQANPRAHVDRVDALFATDDAVTREAVATLIESMGFRPVWVGGLARARELEAMAFLNITLQMATGGNWATSYKLVGAPVGALDHRVPVGTATKK
jgi:predicted dinucleotide-binding enzyme